MKRLLAGQSASPRSKASALMLFHLLFPFADQVGAFNLFRYLTFRRAARW